MQVPPPHSTIVLLGTRQDCSKGCRQHIGGGTAELKHFEKCAIRTLAFSLSSVILPDSVGIEDCCFCTTFTALQNSLLLGFRLLKNSDFFFLSVDTTLFRICLHLVSCSSLLVFLAICDGSFVSELSGQDLWITTVRYSYWEGWLLAHTHP